MTLPNLSTGPFYLQRVGTFVAFSFLGQVIQLHLVAILQLVVCSEILGKDSAVDVLTPFLVIKCIELKELRSGILMLLAATILEHHGSYPRGMYLSAYWVLLVSLYLMRHHLSWVNRRTWAFVFITSSLWIFSFERFVLVLKLGHMEDMMISTLRDAFFRAFQAIGFGFFLVQIGTKRSYLSLKGY